MMLKQQNGITSPWRSFNTVNNTNNNTPRLTINYTVDATGLEDFWGYTEDGVNPANGNIVLQGTDIAVPGRGIPTTVARTYNSRASHFKGKFGYGWHSNINVNLDISAGLNNCSSAYSSCRE